jgi:hypothetical protein
VDPKDTEEDDESGEDALQMGLEALTTAEPASEPVVFAAAESDSDDNLDEVELNEDTPEARNPDLVPLPATNVMD